MYIDVFFGPWSKLKVKSWDCGSRCLFREGALSSEQRKDTSESNKKTSKEEKTRDQHKISTEINLDGKFARNSDEKDRLQTGEKRDDAKVEENDDIRGMYAK